MDMDILWYACFLHPTSDTVHTQFRSAVTNVRVILERQGVSYACKKRDLFEHLNLIRWSVTAVCLSRCTLYTLQGTNISSKNGILKMIFLFPRWDILIPWRRVHVFLLFLFSNMWERIRFHACTLQHAGCKFFSALCYEHGWYEIPSICRPKRWSVLDSLLLLAFLSMPYYFAKKHYFELPPNCQRHSQGGDFCSWKTGQSRSLCPWDLESHPAVPGSEPFGGGGCGRVGNLATFTVLLVVERERKKYILHDRVVYI